MPNTPPTPIDRPHEQSERSRTLDAIRGVAVLGILAVNILSLAWPWETMLNPGLLPDTAWNRGSYGAMELFFLGKMIFLFSCLFGAGAVLFRRPTGRWLQRMAVLAAIGLAHGLLFWSGDILLTYALLGVALVWWVRGLPVRTLAALAATLISIGLLWSAGFAWLLAQATGEWAFNAEESFAVTRDAMLGSWADAFVHRLWELLGTWIFAIFGGWLVLLAGYMTLGAALLRAGFWTGRLPVRRYARLAAALLPTGLAVAALAVWLRASGNANGLLAFAVHQLAAIPLGLGYASLAVWFAKTGRARRAIDALAATGRMALTNYLSHTLVMTTVFMGWGFGLLTRVDYPALWGVVGAMWAANIAASVWWLKRFRFGPVEWLWRCLTYDRIEPLRLAADHPGRPGGGGDPDAGVGNDHSSPGV